MEIRGNEAVLATIAIHLKKARLECAKITSDVKCQRLIVTPQIAADIEVLISDAERKVHAVFKTFI